MCDGRSNCHFLTTKMKILFAFFSCILSHFVSGLMYGKSDVLDISYLEDATISSLKGKSISSNYEILMQIVAYNNKFCLYLEENKILLKDNRLKDIYKPFKGIVLKVDENTECPSDQVTSSGWARLVLSSEKYLHGLKNGKIQEFQGVFVCHGKTFHVETKDSISSHQVRFRGLSGQKGLVIYRGSDVARRNKHDFLKRSQLTEFKTSCDHDRISRNIDGTSDMYAGQSMPDQMDSNGLFHAKNSNGSLNSIKKSGSKYTCSNDMLILPLKVFVDCLYIEKAGGEQNAKKRLLTTINSASEIYEKLNIYLGVISWKFFSQCDSYAFNKNYTATYKMKDRLNDFAGFLAGSDDVTTSLLMTGADSPATLGVGFLKTICTPVKKEKDTQYVGPVISVVHDTLESTVIAHELGHVFGLRHDCNSDQCNNCAYQDCRYQQCIMCGPSCDCNEAYLMSHQADIKHTEFSPWSLNIFCKQLEKKGSCLKKISQDYFRSSEYQYNKQTVSIDENLYNCTDFYERTETYTALCNSKGSGGKSIPKLINIDLRDGSKISESVFDIHGISVVATCIASSDHGHQFFVGQTIRQNGQIEPFAKSVSDNYGFNFLNYSGTIKGCAMTKNGSHLFSVGEKPVSKGSQAVFNIYSVNAAGNELHLVSTKTYGNLDRYEDKINAISFNPNFPSNSNGDFMLVMVGQISGKAAIWFLDESFSVIWNNFLDQKSEFNAVIVDPSTSMVFAAGQLKGTLDGKKSRGYDLLIVSYDAGKRQRLKKSLLDGSSMDDNIFTLDFDKEERYLLIGGYLGGGDSTKVSSSNSEEQGAFVGSVDLTSKSAKSVVIGRLSSDRVISLKLDKYAGKVIGIAEDEGSPVTFLVNTQPPGLDDWQIALISSGSVAAAALALVGAKKYKNSARQKLQENQEDLTGQNQEN